MKKSFAPRIHTIPRSLDELDDKYDICGAQDYEKKLVVTVKTNR